MRISDWSSDVCSSDLLAEGIAYAREKWCDPFGPAFAERLESTARAINRNGIPHHVVLASHQASDEAVLRHLGAVLADDRSDERRVGKECVSTCRSRWSPYH